MIILKILEHLFLTISVNDLTPCSCKHPQPNTTAWKFIISCGPQVGTIIYNFLFCYSYEVFNLKFF